jgi:carbon-monoxide dehydrogenase medium subunit
MFVRPFEYLRAGSVEEASALLAQRGGEAKLLAGGQSLMPMINLGLAHVEALVDISGIRALDGIAAEDHRRSPGSDSWLRIGALTTHRALELDGTVRERQPLLSEAVRKVGNVRVRNLGTLGGSLAHNDPAAELPLVMQVLEAEMTLSDGARTRSLPAGEFFVSYFTTALQEQELLVSIRVPALRERWGWGFHEYTARAGDFAIVAAAAIARCSDGVIEAVRVGLAGAADKAVRLPALEEAARGLRPDELGRVVEAIDAHTEPVGDALVSADYRHHLAGVLATRAIADACGRSRAWSQTP